MLFFLVLVSSFVVAQEKKKKRTIDDMFYGIQFKPIVPFNYFGNGPIDLSDTIVNLSIAPKLGYSMGMVMRKNFTNTLSLETGINYVRRNYNILANEKIRDTSDKADFGLVAYEIPVQFLIYVRLSEHLYMNTSAGIGFNWFVSDVQSVGRGFLIQHLSLRQRWFDFSLLANLGFEYRTEKKGNFYLGASLVNPVRDITNTTINYFYENTASSKYSTTLRGGYFTLDFRYFFPHIKSKD